MAAAARRNNRVRGIAPLPRAGSKGETSFAASGAGGSEGKRNPVREALRGPPLRGAGSFRSTLCFFKEKSERSTERRNRATDGFALRSIGPDRRVG
ncbi:MAG: hypothetical protein KatS3mg117_3195 [Geminicoccaceae bacterium]|nr:MAG: hypothetical protein KatS3mg117_3195 [Geminicoccaceae bacterium]